MIASPAPRPRRTANLMTLVDLALLLVGFFVLVHAFDRRSAAERRALGDGIRAALGGRDTRADPAPPVAMEADRVDGFAPGAAALPAAAIDPVARWLRAAAADPRSVVVITGRSDDTPGDRAGGSGAVTAAARADAVARALVALGAVPAARLRTGAQAGGGRRVDLAITYQP